MVLEQHADLIRETGGSAGIRDLGLLASALAQPEMTWGGQDLYPTLPEKAAVLAFSLVSNHPFVDGNKRIGYTASRSLLLINDWDLFASHTDALATFLALAAGTLDRDALIEWFQRHADPSP